jgi:hypothetical protein
MQIPSLKTVRKRAGNSGLFDFFNSNIKGLQSEDSFFIYEVQKEEDMRIDMVISNMYPDDLDALDYIDIILWINEIDNPLNIYPGMRLKFPPVGSIDDYRVEYEESINVGVKTKMAVPNKTTKKDSNRQKYLNSDFSLPPTVRATPRDPVKLTLDGKIELGGV